MGCTQSKIDNEEAVSRCKDRKLFMKNAVTSRNAFAAAHSAYPVVLKSIGAAFMDFGLCEVRDHRPPQLPVQPTIGPRPPPLPPHLSDPPPLQRATSMPELPIPISNPKYSETILEEEDEAMNADDDSTNLRQRSSRVGRRTVIPEVDAPPPPSPPPPSPPRSPPRTPPSNAAPPPPPDSKGWDYFSFFPDDDYIPGTSGEPYEIRPEKDENEGGVFVGRSKKTENVGVGNHEDVSVKSSNVEPQTPEKLVEPAAKPVKMSKPMAHPQTVSAEVTRGSKDNVYLIQIMSDLDHHFLNASESALDVSKVLEATRVHYHSNFADNRGHIDHSARVMRVITWNRSLKGIPNNDDGKDDVDAEEEETHATVLDKLLAWEKKLYDEVKAGEHMKIEYQRKVTLLNKQKKQNSSTESLEKTKAAVSHLHTRYIVDMQSLDSTVSEINRLRDHQLYPKLVALVDSLTTMWEVMRTHHDRQLEISKDLKSIDISQTPTETSVEHHHNTIQLCGIVQEWHSQFGKLVTYQKDYIQALNSWLRLNLIPIESSLREKLSPDSSPRQQNPPIQGLLRAWDEHLGKLQDDLARSAIFSFAAVMKTIILNQEDEMKLKEKCEEIRKELKRKTRAFEDRYGKQHRNSAGATDPESIDPAADSHYADRQFAIDMLQQKLEEAMEAHEKHCIQVREKTLAGFKTHLSEVFRTMHDFSSGCCDMYEKLKSMSGSQKQTEDPS